jgi:hypothetical protein
MTQLECIRLQRTIDLRQVARTDARNVPLHYSLLQLDRRVAARPSSKTLNQSFDISVLMGVFLVKIAYSEISKLSHHSINRLYIDSILTESSCFSAREPTQLREPSRSLGGKDVYHVQRRGR